MGGLLASLTSSGSAMNAFGRALEVLQNNVGNASTPGYVRQSLDLISMRFDPNGGFGGGVTAGKMRSSRDQYAEQAVRRAVGSQGRNEAYAQLLSGIENAFDISGEAGIPGSMNSLFQSFSAWSLTPNDRSARQSVIDRAAGLAQSVRLAASELGDASRGADVRLATTITSINEIAARLRDYNVELRRGYKNDAGLDAKIHTELEELAGLVDTTIIITSDGSLTVLAGGRVPLVIGDGAYPLELHFGQPADPPPVYPGGPVDAQIIDAGGNDVTSAFSSGTLAGALAFRNGVIPGLLGNAYQPGELNTLAKGLADRVNAILAGGITDAGVPPVAGLFTYDATNDTAVARTFGVDPLMTTAEMGPADPGPPYVVNGTVLKLTALEKPYDAADMLDGSSFMGYYGRVAARVGRATAQARQDGQAATQLAAQARTMRDELCGISLDSEAIQITQFQRAYEASAKMISVLAELSEAAIGIIR